MRKVVVFLSIVLVSVSTALAQNNIVVFDNQSGEPALVKLIGPTSKKVDVATGAKGTVTAAAGCYYIKVRYGTPGKYHYAKGEEFEVKETATSKSETTITLHRVIAGNYDSRLISAAEFAEGEKAATLPPASSPTTMTSQPDGFFAAVTDRTGVTMDVFSFSYNFGYDYPTPGWIGKLSSVKDNPCMSLPFVYKEIAVYIPFADIDVIKFTDNEPAKKGSTEWWQWKPTLIIKLRNETTLTGRLAEYKEYNQRFTGETEFGKFSLPIREVRQIVFDHKRDKNAPRVYLAERDLSGNLDSVYTISIKTWQGNQVTLQNGCQFNLGYGGFKWHGLKTEFDVKIGESTNTISFDKIKNIQFRERGKLKARMTTISGRTIDISLSDYHIWLGGNLEKFGPGRIDIDNVASFEIVKE